MNWNEVARRSPGYLHAPLPSPLDAELASVVDRFADGDEQAREEISESLTLEGARALSAYGERMASHAVHEDSSEDLLRGLVAVGMAAAREDYKDLMLRLPLFDHSARKLTIDPDSLFEQAAEILGDAAPVWLREWPERHPNERSLGTMGYEERPSPNGLLYADW